MKNSSARFGSLSPEKRRLLELRLKQRGISSLDAQTILRRQIASPCPLSFAQQRLWFLHQLEPESTFYLIPYAWRFRGKLNSQILEKSLEELVRRHESLRTTFAMQLDQPVQIINAAHRLVLPVIDLQSLQPEQRELVMRQLVKQEARCPCDLAQGPLLRLHQVRLDLQDHVLLITLHHIITDGWSNEIVIRELTTLYHAFMARQPSPLAPLSIQYADYALWQRNWLQGEVLDAQLRYWRTQLAGAPLLALPTDHPRPPVQTYRGASELCQLPLSLSQAIQHLSQQEQATAFMTLLASFQVLLLRYIGQSDISIGTPIANRQQAETKNVIGFFVNTLVLRTDLSGNPGFLELLRRVREVCLGAYAYQDVPFEQVVEAVEPERDLSRSPLFQVLFTLQNAPQEQSSVADVQISALGAEQTSSKFDLSLTVIETEQGLYGSLQYNTDLFEPQTIQRMLRHWQIILQALVSDPQRSIWQVSLLTKTEQNQLLVDFNATYKEYSRELGVHQLFEQQVERTPDSIALAFADQQMSYHELNRRANQLAHRLRQLGVGPEMLVGLCLERSVELVVGLLAILKAGGAYVPLDPTYPQQRLAFLLEDATLSLLLTREHLRNHLPPTDCTLVCLDALDDMLSPACEENVPEPASGKHLAYVLYTSGSTGSPKGVMVPHIALANYLCWAAQAYHSPIGQRIPLHSPLGFDLTVTSLFVPLITGQGIWLLPDEKGITALSQALSAHNRFTLTKLTPAHLDALEQMVRPEDLAASTQMLVIGGEALWQEHLALWRKYAPFTRLINEYGPTETVVGCCVYEVLPQDPSTGAVPIGKPIANTQIYVLDQYLQPVPMGVVAELYIGGAGVTRGYWGRPELTAERFVPDPWGREPGARLYRTGDLARFLANGDLEYVGRVDQQVKIRGYRVELGEIEAVLKAYPAVQKCVVLVREDRLDDRQLVAYLVAQTGSSFNRHALQAYLQERLPPYMLPSAFVVLETMPLTSNGKVDKRALLQPEEKQALEGVAVQEPRTPIEELLLGLWSQVLGRGQVGRHDNFFVLGGHSLLATRLVARLAAMLHVEVPVRTVFETPTVAGFAQRVAQALQQNERELQIPPLVAQTRPERIPLSFAQQRLWFLDQLHAGSTAYLVAHTHPISGPLNVRVLESSLKATIQRHESLRTTFTTYGGQPVQIVHAAVHYALPVIDISGLTQAHRKREEVALIKQEAQLPFDLTQEPLLRTYLVRSHDQGHLLLLTLHHIITDGWSNEVLLQEVLTLYQAFLSDQPSPLAPLPIQYVDYALWQRTWLQGEMLEAQLAYWTRRLGGAPAISLPIDYPRPPISSTHGTSHFFTLPAELSQAIIALGRQENMTLFMTLLAAFQILFYRYTKQSDIVVGTDTTNRNRVEAEGIVGFFVNLLALRTDLSGNPTFREVLLRVREVTLGAYAHQDTPFELLVEKLASDHYLDRVPIVQVLFVLQNRSLEVEPKSDASQEPARETARSLPTLPIEDSAAEVKFDLALFMKEQDGILSGVLNYRLDLFKASSIASLVKRFEALLQSSVKQPDTPIDLLDITIAIEQTSQKQEKQKRRFPLRVQDDGLFAIPTDGL